MTRKVDVVRRCRFGTGLRVSTCKSSDPMVPPDVGRSEMPIRICAPQRETVVRSLTHNAHSFRTAAFQNTTENRPHEMRHQLATFRGIMHVVIHIPTALGPIGIGVHVGS